MKVLQWITEVASKYSSCQNLFVIFFRLSFDHMDHSLSQTRSSDLVSEVYLDVEAMPLAFFPFISILSWQQYPTNKQGFSYNLNIDDTPNCISNWYFSPIKFHIFYYWLDIWWNLKPACLQLSHFLPTQTRFLYHHFYISYCLRPPALMPVLGHKVLSM